MTNWYLCVSLASLSGGSGDSLNMVRYLVVMLQEDI